jgi:hypothetical protein
MTERFKLSLSGMWLIVSLFSLLLPVFLPSNAFSGNPAADVIGTATATMFILSFPSSLFGVPLLVVVDYVLSVDPNSIQGMYVNLFVLFVLGLVQWFWIVPRVWRREPDVQMLNLPIASSLGQLAEAPANADFDAFASRESTPVDRLINEDDI